MFQYIISRGSNSIAHSYIGEHLVIQIEESASIVVRGVNNKTTECEFCTELSSLTLEIFVPVDT